MADPCSISCDLELVEMLREGRAVHPISRVHTPEDNGAPDHQHREIKGEAGLGNGV